MKKDLNKIVNAIKDSSNGGLGAVKKDLNDYGAEFVLNRKVRKTFTPTECDWKEAIALLDAYNINDKQQIFADLIILDDKVIKDKFSIYHENGEEINIDDYSSFIIVDRGTKYTLSWERV